MKRPLHREGTKGKGQVSCYNGRISVRFAPWDSQANVASTGAETELLLIFTLSVKVAMRLHGGYAYVCVCVFRGGMLM